MGQFLYLFEPGGGNEGDGDGTDATDLDDDTLGLLDALDDTGATGELTFLDADLLAWLVEEGGVVVEVADLVALRGDDTDEVLHLVVGNSEDSVFSILGGYGISPVAHGHKGWLLLEVGDDHTGGVDEDQSGDGRDETGLDIEVVTIVNGLHGKEILDAFLVEGVVDLEHTVAFVVGHSHGVPEGLAHLFQKLFRQERVTATRRGRGQNGPRCIVTRHFLHCHPATFVSRNSGAKVRKLFLIHLFYR